MKKLYNAKVLLFISASFLLLLVASCKKDEAHKTTPVITAAAPTKLGLYEGGASIYKQLLIAVSQIGSVTAGHGLIFDTGSGGLVIDADGILPASIITVSGFNFAGDSTLVAGITVTAQTSIIEYGDDAGNIAKVYGNLAYASVTIGDKGGNVVIKRLPFFLYYKAVDVNGNAYAAHKFDVFGVSPQYDIGFSNGVYITSPLSYFDPGPGLKRGFKLAALGTAHFLPAGSYVPGVLTLGLTADDISSSGFVMTALAYNGSGDYLPVIPATITYNGKSVSTNVVFDTGTQPYSYIEDGTAPAQVLLLPQHTSVTVATGSGFSYSYTVTATENLTYLENPAVTIGNVSIISLEFFLNNEYMLNYTDHTLGLKNN